MYTQYRIISFSSENVKPERIVTPSPNRAEHGSYGRADLIPHKAEKGPVPKDRA